MSTLPKLIYRLNMIPTKIPTRGALLISDCEFETHVVCGAYLKKKKAQQDFYGFRKTEFKFYMKK